MNPLLAATDLAAPAPPILVVKQVPREAYQSVLVPVDFSPWSQGAIRLALAVAPQAELILLHAYEEPFEGKLRFAGVEEESIRRHRETTRREALARLQQAAIAASNWRHVVIYGDAATCILEQAEEAWRTPATHLRRG